MFFCAPDGDDAPVSYLTFHVLELNGCVVDAEAMQQALFHIAQNTFTDRRRKVIYRDMAGEGVGFRPDAPNVQVMNVFDTVDAADRVPDLAK